MTDYYEIMDVRCDKRAALAFDSENQGASIGHLLSLSFISTGTQLLKDLQVCNPEKPETAANIVGVFDFIAWEGFDVVHICGHLSFKNKAIMQEALAIAKERPLFAIEFVIYSYDYHEKKYFQNFHTNKQPRKFGITERTRINVASEPDRMIETPILFPFSMSLTALGEDQEVCFSTSASGTTHKHKLRPNPRVQ